MVITSITIILIETASQIIILALFLSLLRSIFQWGVQFVDIIFFKLSYFARCRRRPTPSDWVFDKALDRILVHVVFSISEMIGYVVALIGDLFLSIASSLIHETSPFGVKTTLFLATFVEYY